MKENLLLFSIHDSIFTFPNLNFPFEKNLFVFHSMFASNITLFHVKKTKVQWLKCQIYYYLSSSIEIWECYLLDVTTICSREWSKDWIKFAFSFSSSYCYRRHILKTKRSFIFYSWSEQAVYFLEKRALYMTKFEKMKNIYDKTWLFRKNPPPSLKCKK